MLLQFKVSNFRSIAEEQIISLIPAPKQREFGDNILETEKYSSLNAIAFYGPNGSGKSNLLKAMSLMDRMLHLSARSSSTTKLPYDPFMLREGWNSQPTSFEIIFILEDARYRYGMEFNEKAILSEWLYRKLQSREVMLFERKEDIIETTSGFRGSSKAIDAAIEATRENALFLSTCDMLNIEEAKLIFGWLRNYNMVDGLRTEDEEIQTVHLWQQEEFREKIKQHFTKLNLGVVDLEITTRPFDANELNHSIPEELRSLIIEEMTGKERYTIWAKHMLYDKSGNATKNLYSWKLEDNESAGTKKAFHLSGPIVWALVNGGTLIIDEIEAKMHPVMTVYIVNLFMNKESNPENAQLIFATHDTNLLSFSNLRRDQIYFTEKNSWEATEIYSLSDFIYGTNKERPDSDKEKRYFEGRYGAIPELGRFKPSKVKDNGKERQIRNKAS